MRNEKQIRDGYADFFEICNKDTFFNFGLERIITIDKEVVAKEWDSLKSAITKKSNEIYVRDFGRNGIRNEIIAKMYSDIYGIEINFDSTNNDKPSRMLQKLTGYRKNKSISNYQVSHVFGNTKNIYCFTAPWNIVFIPKILDPFTGHEAKGTYVKEFRKLFNNKIFEQFKEHIADFNHIMDEQRPKIEEWVIQNIEDSKFRNAILKEYIAINRII